jgi:hypothetical protein
VTTKRAFRKLTLSLLWGMAVSTWAAIGHYLFGLPDVGLPAVILAVAAIILWPSAAVEPKDVERGSLEAVGLTHTRG